MKIVDVIRTGEPVFSFEFFPPKNEEGLENLFKTLGELRSYQPAYVSVTYGAGGSTRNQTVDLVSRIKNDLGLEAMAHLTCVGATQTEIGDVLGQMRDAGIENILALRGDPPKGADGFVQTEGGFRYASELTAFLKSDFDFCIAGACYPELHPEAENAEQDMEALVAKVDAGADFLISQLFFDNRDYFDFVDRLRTRGVTVPVVAGIMPVTNVAQVKRFTQMCGARLPQDLLEKIEAVDGDAAAVRRVGVEYATAQCEELLKKGCPGIHFYTLNRSLSTRKILDWLMDNESLPAVERPVID